MRALTPAGLTQVSGEAATGSQQATFNAMDLFLGILSDPFVASRGNGATANGVAPAYAEEGYDVSAYAPGDTPRSKNERDAYAAIYRKAPAMADPLIPRWSVWAAGYGGSQTTDGNASLGSSTATSSVAGVAVGRRLPHLAVHNRRLRNGGRRHQFQCRQRAGYC